MPVEATFCPLTNTISLTGVKYTTRWASPELLKTNKPSLASDIWAFGWVGYETLKQPMVTPNPVRTADTADLANRSAELLMKLGHLYRQQSDYPKASEYYTKALSVYTDIGERKGRANALKFLANAYLLQDRKNLAFRFYSECLQIWTEIGERGGKADALWGLAAVHRARYQYSQAFTLYSECLKIRTDIGDRPGRCDPLRGLAEIHRLRKEYSQALELYCSVSLIPDVPCPDPLSGPLKFYVVPCPKGHAASGQVSPPYSECLLIRTEIGDRRGRASALWGLAEIHRLRKDYSQAFAFYSECIQIYTDLGHKGRKADALWGLGQTHLARKEYIHAVKSYSECLPIFTDIGDRDGKAIAFWGLARAHLMEGRYSRAISLYFSAIKLGSINNIGVIQYWRAPLARIETKSPQSRNISSDKLRRNLKAS
ncbi:hypothetical protein FRC00_004008 [Tulasnella sp. 408]|nr:hypothetical protein FRC00_004008 [Tulasnella sp. 408]